MQYSPNIRVIRVMCSSRIGPEHILNALTNGIDGVLVAGCHPGDCHYQTGNLYTRRRVMMLKKLLETIGIAPKRLRLEWVSASEGNKFAEVVNDFVEELREIGPNPMKEAKE